jgi:hypothetical protein
MIKTNYKEQAAEMSIYQSHGRKLILRPFSRNMREKHKLQKGYPDPNFLNTGLALVAVLKEDQSFSEFKEYWIKNQKIFNGK